MVGIDKPIERLRTRLNEKLSWVTAYGRCYRNEKEDGIKPEVYIGDNNYKDVLHDNTENRCFFDVVNRGSFIANMSTAVVDVIFIVNIEETGVEGRDTEALHAEVMNVIEDIEVFKLDSLSTGSDALTAFAAGTEKFHPWYTFKFTCNVNFYYC